jgi:hypothetical protein
MEATNNKSMTAKEEISYWDNILDEYENTMGLPKYNSSVIPESELNTYLTMSRDEIEKLTPEDCGQIAYRLGQFSFHTQRTINREQARFDWAEDTIRNIIADELNNYKGYGYAEKSAQAIKHNDRAGSLEKIKKYAKQRINRLSYLANSINNLSNILINVQKLKVKHGS